ncbi:MAG: tRNA pseudouridine synthase A, partial [Ferruginibacter sp.]
MERYFIEVFYQGARYAGFQAQENANTIQAEVEKAFKIYYRVAFSLTGSSRTDAGVHALQNFFHVDTALFEGRKDVMKDVYHLNAILPSDIVIRNIYKVLPEAHCRFSATARNYQYTLYSAKNPFYESTGFYFPYPLQLNKLNEAADYLKHQTNFEAFAKKNSQVHSFICSLKESTWHILEDRLLYT